MRVRVCFDFSFCEAELLDAALSILSFDCLTFVRWQKLSDIIPALDMVHSSLISSISIDPVRLNSFQMPEVGKVPTIISFGNANSSISLSSSLRANPVQVSLSSSLRQAPTQGIVLGSSVSNLSLSSSLNRAPVSLSLSVCLQLSL